MSEGYAIALQRLIEDFRAGRPITDELTAQCPHHAAMLKEMQLQPVETAPKDGTHILMYRDGLIQTAWWRTGFYADDNDYGWGGIGWSYPDWSLPTHWMPMPEVPK